MIKIKKTWIFFFLVLLGSLYLLFRTDEQYLESTTRELLSLASVSSPMGKTVKTLKRVEKIVKHLHFNVNVQLKFNERMWQARTVNELRSFLMLYFSKMEFLQLKDSHFLVQIEKTNEGKKGDVTFQVHGSQKEASFSCSIKLIWIKKPKWFISNIEVFKCSPISF